MEYRTITDLSQKSVFKSYKHFTGCWVDERPGVPTKTRKHRNRDKNSFAKSYNQY